MQNNKLINQVLVESPAGNKAFNLILGDILQDDGQLTILNVYEDETGIVGDFSVQVLAQQQNERVIGYLHDGGRITFVEAPKCIITIYVKKNEHEAITEEEYAQYIQAIFSAIMHVELIGYTCQTIALPVLFRKAIKAIHAEAIHVLIKQAERWLEKSLHTTSIRYYVYLPQDMEMWNQALNQVLGRAFIDVSEAGDLQQIRRLLLIEMERFSQYHPIYHDTLLPLKSALERPQLTMEVIAAFARKLAESLCEELVGQAGNSFDTNIYQLRQQGHYSAVFIQRLYVVKAFGNSAVHRQINDYAFMPVQSDDLQILLLIILQLIKDFPKEVLLIKTEVN